MVLQNFAGLKKLGLRSQCSQNFSGCSFARARVLNFVSLLIFFFPRKISNGSRRWREVHYLFINQ